MPILMVGLLLLIGFSAKILLPGCTQLQLQDGQAGGRLLFSQIFMDGEEARLTWHNSLFDLDVTENFITRGGNLVQTAVTFADPRGLAPMAIPPEEVDDFYHTGGPFTTSGLDRRFSHIVYRIGEIGHPHFTIGTKTIDFKQEVGFGGRVILRTEKPTLLDLFHFF